MASGFIVGEVERYINSINLIMPIRSWKEMKETLMLKFGADEDPEKTRLKIYLDRCHDYVMNWKLKCKSETIQAKSSEDDELVIHPDIGFLDMSDLAVKVNLKDEMVSDMDVVSETEL